MVILLIFAFISGLFTIAAPCIWPLLPIVLSASASGGKRRPLGITLGIVISFAFFTLTTSYLVSLLHFDPNFLRYFAVVIIMLLGLSLLIPALSAVLEGGMSRLSGKLGVQTTRTGFVGGLITGISIGIVWTPCAGPTLATIATLAATQTVNFGIVLVTLAYVTGIWIPLFILSHTSATILTKSRVLSPYTPYLQRFFGSVMILTALLLVTNYDKVLSAKLLDMFPSYGNFLTNKIEGSPAVRNQLAKLKGQNPPVSHLSSYGTAPEFTGISNWLNIPDGKSSLTMKELRGKVVLIDFWTYTCINCVRTLPFVTRWYDKYSKDGLVVVGVHTPEFAFERDTRNVSRAIDQFGIHYPVAQDNDYATWNAYANQYWPAKYLIDAKGTIRYVHFGEGEYDKTEAAIKALLQEAGKTIDPTMVDMPDQTPSGMITPETYLGANRLDRFASNELPLAGPQKYTAPTAFPDNFFALSGTWDISGESAKSGKGASLLLQFTGQNVFLVMTPKFAGQTVTVFLDGKQVFADGAGADVKNGMVTLDTDRLYHLIHLPSVQKHILRLEFEEGTSLFAFTFG